MEFLDELFILLVVLQAVYGLYQRVTGGDAAQKAEAMPPPEADDGTRALLVERAREQVEAARGHVAHLRARATALGLRLSGPGLAPLADAVAGRISPALAALDRALAEQAAALPPPAADPAALPDEDAVDWALLADRLRGALGELHRQSAALTAIEAAVRWREDPRLGPVLADVDAVAASMLDPLAAAARHERLDWPTGAPITLPAGGDPEAVRALLPDHPVVFVDADVADEQTRWPAVIEAVSRTVVHTRPGLVAPLRAHFAGGPPWLPRQQGRRVIVELDALCAEWLDVVVADAVAAVMMGPVALRGFVARWARPDDPYAVVRVERGADHRLAGPTPPPHLRVHLMAAALHEMGFDIEARALRDGWDAQHDEPATLVMPSLFGPSVQLPVDRAAAPLRPRVMEVAVGRHPAFGGRRFASIGAFEMSPGLWARTRQRAADLAGGRRFAESPRIVVAAAILAAEQSPGGFGPRLNRLVHGLIVEPGERPAPDPRYRPRRPDLGEPLGPRELIEAVALRAVLRRPRAHRPPPRRALRPPA